MKGKVKRKRKQSYVLGLVREHQQFVMGGSVSQVFRSGSALLSNRDGKVSEHTIDKIHTIFEILRANPKISMQTLEGLLTQIAKVNTQLFFHKFLELFSWCNKTNNLFV